MSDKKDVYEPQVGDVVMLNSGGPAMTVVKVCPAVAASNTSPPTLAKEAEIECWWFNPLEPAIGAKEVAGGILQKATFVPEAVNLKSPVSKPAPKS